MKVLLSNAPWYEEPIEGIKEGFCGIRAGSRWPHTGGYRENRKSTYRPFPFFLAITSALLKEHGQEVVMRDSINLGDTIEEYLDYVKTNIPEIIIFETSTVSLGYDIKIVKRIKQMMPNVLIVFTGVHVELENVSFLERHGEIDYAIYGEYELSVLELVKQLSNDREMEKVPSLVYRDSAGTVLKNPRIEPIDLDKLPWADREYEHDSYWDGFCGLEEPQLQMHTSRGCPFHCNFCVWPQVLYGNHQYRTRKPQDVIDEIKYHLGKSDYKSIYFDDDAINISKEHILEICRLMKENGLDKIRWACMGRADLMDDEILKALKDAGCVAIKYGVETFNQEVLDKTGKGMNVEKNIKYVKKTREEYKIKTHLTYCIGLLGETRKTIEDTLEKAFKVECDSMQFSIATPFPGSKLWHICTENGWIKDEDYDKLDGANNALIPLEDISQQEIECLVKEAIEQAHRNISAMLSLEFTDKINIDKWKQFVGANKRVLITCTSDRKRVKKIYEEIAEANDVYVITSDIWRHELLPDIPTDKLICIEETQFTAECVMELSRKSGKMMKFDKILVPIRGNDISKYENVEKALKAYGHIAYINEFAQITG